MVKYGSFTVEGEMALAIDGNQVMDDGTVVAILRWAGEVRRVVRPDGTILGRLYPNASRMTWRAWTAWDQFQCTFGDEEVTRGVPLADAVGVLLKARGDVLHGCRHAPVPAPGTIVSVFGITVSRGARYWEYPLTSECATCHYSITLADSMADWYHPRA